MKTTIEYLDIAKKMLEIESDYELARQLDLGRSSISGYRKGKNTFDDYTALKIARVLKIDPMEVIAAANAERAKSEEEKKDWENFSKRLGGAAATIVLMLVGFNWLETLLQIKNLYIM